MINTLKASFAMLFESKTIPEFPHYGSFRYCKGPHTLQLKLQKSSYRPYTPQLFFTAATIFSTVLYMSCNFHKDFLEKLL